MAQAILSNLKIKNSHLVMDIFFNRHYKYHINGTVNDVRNKLAKITENPWSDFSENITGKLNDDNSFKLTHKWSLGYIRWIENSFAYITGTIKQDGDITVIYTTLRPNSGIVLFFYIFVVLFLCELVGIHTMLEAPKIFILFFIPFFDLILFGLMFMMTNGLINRFEKILQLQKKE
ncbi:MAG: hypothetical protein ABI691_22175 [Ginsengibacter sp.]